MSNDPGSPGDTPGMSDYDECDQVIGVDNPERFLRYMGVRRPLKTLDEVNAAGEGFPAITAFVDWLRANGMEIGLRPVLPGARLIPVEDEAEKFSAAFYDIDWEQLQADRAEFVYRIQQAQSSPTEPGDRS